MLKIPTIFKWAVRQTGTVQWKQFSICKKDNAWQRLAAHSLRKLTKLGDEQEEVLTLRNRQQAVGYFVLHRKHRLWIQHDAVFIKNILKTPLWIRIFFWLQTQILQHNNKIKIFYQVILIIFDSKVQSF